MLDDAQLDALVAPVALYPDALLTQVLVAATYPLDLVKADRFLADNPDLPDKERADKAEAEDWDPSVQVLAGGFPTVVQKMADDIDWSEDLGDAMLAQTDDLLDAVQRMRARAAAAGNLESNDAQVVDTTEDDQISIAPADPDVVYVPSYDSTAAYQPVATTTTPVATTTTGMTTGDILTTGAIAFGSALLINEIFDNDNDDWDNYWRGPPPINWDNNDVYPRRGINAGGDVNIDVDRNRNTVRIGDRDRPNLGRDGAWKADPKQRDAARDKLAARGDGAGAAKAREKLGAGPGRNDAQAKLDAAKANHKIAPSGKAGGPLAGGGGNGDAAAKLKAAGADHKVAPRKGEAKTSALKPGAKGDHPKAAAARGAGSLKGDKSATAAKARQAGTGHAKAISKPKAAKAPPRKPAAKSSAMKKPQGAHRAPAAKKRGSAHAGKAKRK